MDYIAEPRKEQDLSGQFIPLTRSSAILLMVLCTIFTSTGQLLWKKGIMSVNLFSLGSLLGSVLNAPLLLGFLSYGIGAFLMLLAFRRGELSVLYPIIATSYVWVSLFSPWLFPSDAMNGWKWAGVITILISVSLLGWSNSGKLPTRYVREREGLGGEAAHD